MLLMNICFDSRRSMQHLQIPTTNSIVTLSILRQNFTQSITKLQMYTNNAGNMGWNVSCIQQQISNEKRRIQSRKMPCCTINN